MRRTFCMFAASLAVLACGNDESNDKPDFDPDLAVSAAKADGLSDYWTDIRGQLPVGSSLQESIDFPSFFFGRTAQLSAGQRFQIDLRTNQRALVRLYGPAIDVIDGYPIFGRPLVRADTRKDSGEHVSGFAFDVPADGTYMLVYGPKWVWQADFYVEMRCLEGCAAAEACDGDWDCHQGEFCGDNGVRCVRAPCDANFDVCQAKVGAGEGCSRDGECQAGLACRGGGCTAELCETDDDCDDGFCGWSTGSGEATICKDYAMEGESCGGFRPADTVRFCSPEYACVGPYDVIADIPGHCGAMTTAEEVLADPRAFDGRFIAIKGVLHAGPPICTLMACDTANPCCNSCGADLRLFDDPSQVDREGIYTTEEGANLGCGGNECTWADNCAVAPGNAWVAGWFHLDNGITPRLDIVARYPY